MQSFSSRCLKFSTYAYCGSLVHTHTPAHTHTRASAHIRDDAHGVCVTRNEKAKCCRVLAPHTGIKEQVLQELLLPAFFHFTIERALPLPLTTHSLPLSLSLSLPLLHFSKLCAKRHAANSVNFADTAKSLIPGSPLTTG